MSKLFAVLVVGLFIAGGISTISVASDEAMTNAEFAELLAGSIGLELPPIAADLSDAEYFEVIANILAARGMDYFMDKNAGDIMTAGGMAEVLYAMVGGADDLTPDEIINFLVASDYMAPADADATISLVFASNTLNNPVFADAVVEAYRAPEDPGGGARDAGVGVPGVVPEPPGSQI